MNLHLGPNLMGVFYYKLSLNIGNNKLKCLIYYEKQAIHMNQFLSYNLKPTENIIKFILSALIVRLYGGG